MEELQRGEHREHHHHHYHQEEELDLAEIVKRKAFLSNKGRNFIGRFMFYLLSIMAMLIVIAVCWLYAE